MSLVPCAASFPPISFSLSFSKVERNFGKAEIVGKDGILKKIDRLTSVIVKKNEENNQIIK